MNNVEDFRDYCISKPGTTEEFPFDENVLAFKVMGKIFALTNLRNESFTANLKCNPDWAIELRAEYESEIIAGYHMNKKHWNTVTFDGNLPNDLKIKMIDHSYNLVVKSLTKKQKTELESKSANEVR